MRVFLDELGVVLWPCKSQPEPSSMGKSSWKVSLSEGAVVAVVTRGADESFSLTETQENELLAAMAEIERGEYVTLEELLQSLPKHG